jgi:butyryl-CoA dehydrogenase
MDFFLTDEQQVLQNMAANFAATRLAPKASEWDEKKIFPVDVLREAAALGMAGTVARTDIGGSGLSRLEAALVFEQLAAGCVSTAAYLSIHNMVTTLVDTYASEALRLHYGPRLTNMTLFASYCLSEPNAGSDAASLQTKAEKQGDVYILNGAKAFISGGGHSDVYACMVRTGDASYKGISCILVDKDTPGLSFGLPEHKMGWNAQPTTMVYFENCRVPCHQRVGEEGEGFSIALKGLNGGRINIAACSLGGALAC